MVGGAADGELVVDRVGPVPTPTRRYCVLAMPEPPLPSEGLRVTVTALLLQPAGALSVTVGTVVSMLTVQVPVELTLPALSRAWYS